MQKNMMVPVPASIPENIYFSAVIILPKSSVFLTFAIVFSLTYVYKPISPFNKMIISFISLKCCKRA